MQADAVVIVQSRDEVINQGWVRYQTLPAYRSKSCAIQNRSAASEIPVDRTERTIVPADPNDSVDTRKSLDSWSVRFGHCTDPIALVRLALIDNKITFSPWRENRRNREELSMRLDETGGSIL
jgi:hypothetical protein